LAIKVEVQVANVNTFKKQVDFRLAGTIRDRSASPHGRMDQRRGADCGAASRPQKPFIRQAVGQKKENNFLFPSSTGRQKRAKEASLKANDGWKALGCSPHHLQVASIPAPRSLLFMTRAEIHDCLSDLQVIATVPRISKEQIRRIGEKEVNQTQRRHRLHLLTELGMYTKTGQI